MNAIPHLVLLGAGGHAAVVAEAARLAGMPPVGLFADEAPDLPSLADLDHLGTIDAAAAHLAAAEGPVAAHAAVGDGRLRREWLEGLPDVDLPAIVHPRAIVSPRAAVRAAAFVGPGAIVNAGAVVGRGAIVNSGAIVEHDARVGAFAHVAPGAVLGGGASVGELALVGLSAAVLPRVTVGARAVLAAGGIARRPVPDDARHGGVPARPLSAPAGTA